MENEERIAELYTLMSVEGYKCTGYDPKSKKFSYICDKGHSGAMRKDHWLRPISPVRCPICKGNKKLTIEFVREEFAKEGYTLISEEYVNSKTHLHTTCSGGHDYFTTRNLWVSGHRCMECWHLEELGESNPNYKGGLAGSDIPLYDTYAPQLEKYQEVFKVPVEGVDLLGVHCKFCKKIFVPTQNEVRRRIATIKGKYTGESNIYCSEECKHACPTYRQVLYTKDNKPYKENDRPDQPAWAKMVKERDNYTCVNCGSTEGPMVAHHIKPVSQDPLESMDIDNGKTLCKACDKLVHQTPGCTLAELRCN